MIKTVKIAKRFDRGSLNWDKDAKFNELFLNAQKVYIDDMLESLGYVFLSDVYILLGLPVTRDSCILGWSNIIEDGGGIRFKWSQIGKTPDFELVFECYPILIYLPEEEGVV